MLFRNPSLLTATVAHGTAGALVVYGRAAIHMQGALLHDALGLVVNAVAQLAWLVRIRGHLSAFRVELLLDAAAKLLWYAQLGARLGCMIRHIHRHYRGREGGRIATRRVESSRVG